MSNIFEGKLISVLYRETQKEAEIVIQRLSKTELDAHTEKEMLDRYLEPVRLRDVIIDTDKTKWERTAATEGFALV